MAVTLDTSGLDNIMRNLRPKARQIISSAAHEVEARAKPKAPYLTGALMNSIQAEPIPGADLSWWVHDGVEYGIFQEFGTSRGVPPHPFMVPAVESLRNWYIGKWKELFTT